MKKCRYLWMPVFIVLFSIILVACDVEETDATKIKDLDYTVCDEGKLPDELVELINGKKKEPFKLTYRTKDYLYIVVGYGAQDRTDLSIALKELYLTKNAIFVETEMNAVDDTTLEDNMVSYPWIAVKCELYDEEVIFQ